MFWIQLSIGDLLDSRLRIGYVLDRVAVAPARAKDCLRRTTNEVRRLLKEPTGSVQLDHGRLEEAFAPSVAKSQALVKGLPANAHPGDGGIRISIQPFVIAHPRRKLQ